MASCTSTTASRADGHYTVRLTTEPLRTALLVSVYMELCRLTHLKRCPGAVAGVPFGQVHDYIVGSQPAVSLLDGTKKLRAEACPENEPCRPVVHAVTALIYNNPGCSQLMGNNVVETVDGVARFTNLMIENEAREYRLQFLAGPSEAPLQKISSPFQVVHGRINLGLIDGTVASLPPQQAGGVLPDIEVFVQYFDPASETWILSEAYEGVISIDSPQESCEQRDQTTVCRPQVLSGTQAVEVVDGHATFTDLTIYRAQTTSAGALLRFQLDGMIAVCGNGVVSSFTVAPADPSAVMLTGDGPNGFIIAGTSFPTNPSVNLVDRYKNSILETGWFIHISATGFTSPWNVFRSFEVRVCVDEGCNIHDPILALPLNDAFIAAPPGIAIFESLVLLQAGKQIVLKMTAGRSVDMADADRTILPAFTSPFGILANALDNLDILQAPATERWVTADRVPDGATVGIPFRKQPRIALVDLFKNPIEALTGNLIEVELFSTSAEADSVELGGTTRLLSQKVCVESNDSRCCCDTCRLQGRVI